jgi:zinc/manganese transport system substrate-binding protein
MHSCQPSRFVVTVLAALVPLLAGGAALGAEPIGAVGVETQYADVIAQIGGKYVAVSAIESDPNVDPHSFEASPKIARQLGAAALVVENGLGYDGWADRLLAAAPNAARKVINVQHLLGLPDGTANPHLWYDPKTMPAVARAVADDLAALRPDAAAYFAANEQKFEASLKPWADAIAAFRAAHPAVPVAVSEPVADYLLQALGADIKTPATLEAAVMNDNDPSPQDISAETGLLADGAVKVFAYNRQVTDDLTSAFLDAAKAGKVPVVAVYETMPAGFTYQGWMLAATQALEQAVTAGVSTEKLVAKQ